MVGLLDRPTTGRIIIDGVPVTDFGERRLAKLRSITIGFIFQRFLLFPTLTVRENIELPLLFNSDHGRRADTDAILARVELTERQHHRPSQLSGGEMQRVAIGRALILNPPVILADEPTGNLDSATAEKIFELLKNLQQQGQTIIVVTHNRELADRADRILALKDGMLKEQAGADSRRC
jgi:putative ABC transport system ATP-binding protein